MSTWSKLTEEQRSEIVSRVENGEDITRVAVAFELNAGSLSRKIRKLREKGELEQYRSPIEYEEIASEHSTFTEEKNEAVLDWYSGDGPIKTLDELIESHEIDLDIWVLHGSVLHNTWTTPRARKGSEGFEYFQNHQVKARFIRKEPIPVFPTIQPVTIDVQYAPPPEPRTDGIGMSYALADPHFGFVKDLKTAKLTPFHNRKVLDLHLQMIEILKPDRVDVLGDLLDMSEWTDRFLKEPEFRWTTQPALEEATWFLAQVRMAAPNAVIDLHQGNHEKRLEDAIKTHFPAAHQLQNVDELHLPPALSLPRLLALHKLNINWIGDYPNDRVYINDLLGVEHGGRALSPGQTAKAIISESNESVAFGHVHRWEMLTRTIQTRFGPMDITGFSIACSCWTDGRVPGSKRNSQWQNGGAILEYEINGEQHNILPLSIAFDELIYQGQLFTGRDRTEEIREALNGWNI